jgi:exonuclease III
MTEFSILTFNLWHDLRAREARAAVFIELVKQTKPDIICLQECTIEVTNHINPALAELGYVKPMMITDDSQIQIYVINTTTNPNIKIIRGKYVADAVDPYGKVKFPETKMNRELMYCTVKISHKTSVTIGTCHFDSEFGKHNTVKHGQYRYAETLLRKIYHDTNANNNIFDCDRSSVLLCGDFSVGGVEDGLELSKTFDTNGWLDTWRVTGADPKHEITFNRETNPYNKESKYHSRLDRMIYLGDSIKCVEHRVIAGFIDKQSGTKYVVSDHYGVLAKFRVNSSVDSN